MSDGSSDVCSSDLDHAHRIEERQDPQIGKADATVRAMGQGHFECGQYARGLALEIMVPLTIFDGKGAADFPCFGVVDRAYVSGKDMHKMIYQHRQLVGRSDRQSTRLNSSQ